MTDQNPDETVAADATVEPDTPSDVQAEAPDTSHRAEVARASRHENPTDRAESLGTGLGDQATGDIVIDASLQDLKDAPSEDLDAQIEAGQRVQQTLQSRLSDLGGE